jgi:hypothetical protein
VCVCVCVCVCARAHVRACVCVKHDGHYHVLAIHPSSIFPKTLFAVCGDVNASWRVENAQYFLFSGFPLIVERRAHTHTETFFHNP